jgi:hypothetical protein
MTKCPNCGKTLELKSESAFGKKTACPQCSEPFTVKPYKKKKAKPVARELEDEYDGYRAYADLDYDNYGTDDQYGDYESSPR